MKLLVFQSPPFVLLLLLVLLLNLQYFVVASAHDDNVNIRDNKVLRQHPSYGDADNRKKHDDGDSSCYIEINNQVAIHVIDEDILRVFRCSNSRSSGTATVAGGSGSTGCNSTTTAIEAMKKRQSLVVVIDDDQEDKKKDVKCTVGRNEDLMTIHANEKVVATASIASGLINFYNPTTGTNAEEEDKDLPSPLLKELASQFDKTTTTNVNNNAVVTVTQEWELQSTYKEEALYGGGQYVNGLLNYRSAPMDWIQFNTEAVVPFLTSTKGWGVLWDLYGETVMNPPQHEIVLKNSSTTTPTTTKVGYYTPTTSGPHWFLVRVCNEKFGCGQKYGNPGFTLEMITLGEEESSQKQQICNHTLANIPKSIACRVDHLKAGVRYKFLLTGKYNERKLFVTSIATHNKLSLQTKSQQFIDYYFVTSTSTSTSSRTRSSRSSRSVGISSSLSTTTTTSSNVVVVEEEKEEGRNSILMDGVIHNYRRLTGTSYLYAKWVYGFWQCKEHYSNQTELTLAAQKFRKLQIPVDAFVQDWKYWGHKGWGPQWDPKVYPSPSQMIQTLASQHIHFMVSVWSRFDPKTKFYKEMNSSHALIPGGSTYMDVWNPTAQQLFYKFAQDAHFDIGVDSLWLDATEPENSDQLGQSIYLGSGDEYANTYSLEVSKTIHDGLKSYYPNRRVFSLTRSSFAGQQRYGASLWSGDITASWDSLRRQIAMSINYQLSGIPYWTMDTGGFFRPRNQYVRSDYHQLLVRWFQFSVFTPIMRVHGCGSNTELWNYGKQVQDLIVTSAIRFRYRLLEYIYSGFYMEVEQNHGTMQRALIMDFASTDFTNVRDIADQYMFGKSFLVAPIYQPTSSRSIYLPKLLSSSLSLRSDDHGGGGEKWRCFYSGQPFTGGQWIQFENVTLSRIPLFVRSSILVLGPDGRQHVNDLGSNDSDDDNNGNSNEEEKSSSVVVPGRKQKRKRKKKNSKLEVRIYDGADSQFDLFDDDGVSSDPDRPISIINFSWNDQSRILTIGDARGNYHHNNKATTAARMVDIVVVRPGFGGGIDPVSRPDATVSYNGTAVSVQLSHESRATTAAE